MASQFDFNYQQFGKKMLPPDKRMPGILAFLNACLYPLQWLRDLFLGDYRQGAAAGPSMAQPWLTSTTYNTGDRVTYKRKMYESLIDGNLNIAPTDQTAWVVRLQNFLGTDERSSYNGFHLVLTYALNRNFSTIFRQPPSVSDIFITKNIKDPDPFIVGASEDESSVIFADTSSEFIVNEYTFSDYFNCTINVPAAVFAAIDPDPSSAESIIRNFVDPLILGGIIYNIVTY